MKLRESIYFATKRANSLYLYSTFDVHSNYLSTLRVKLLVKKYEPRFIVALWLAWGDEAIGTYTVNSAFNETVCLLSWRYCYVWSVEKLYTWTLARSKSVKEVLTYLSLSQDFFLSFFFFPISRQKRYVEIAFSAFWRWQRVEKLRYKARKVTWDSYHGALNN